ncbi:hypothetical protein BROUX41_001274 [Berkeleyomyces rouxiae]|uniref:uncharacterized protein n=1 Tax=Berkeleyomyces rouxiae TaxID=2035830 RepID=UPI003B79CA40
MAALQPLTMISPKPEPESLDSLPIRPRYDGRAPSPNRSPPLHHISSAMSGDTIAAPAVTAPKTPDLSYQRHHQAEPVPAVDEEYRTTRAQNAEDTQGGRDAPSAPYMSQAHVQNESQSQSQSHIKSQSQFYSTTSQAYGPPPPHAQYGMPPVPVNPYAAPYYPSASWAPYPGPPVVPLQPQVQPLLKLGDDAFVDDLFDISELRRSCRDSLHEYVTLVAEASKSDAYRYDGAVLQRMVNKQGEAIAVLAALRQHLTDVMRSSEKCRFRTWVSGLVAWVPRISCLVLSLCLQVALTTPSGSIVPIIKSVFRRIAKHYPRLDAANDTEYAFKRSRTLTDYLKASVAGRKRLAGVSMFLFAVLYVFQNEILLRVSRTMYKRVRRLHDKMVRGQHMVTQEDLTVMDGWRWRVISWAA